MLNLRGSACVCFPCIHINPKEQHLAKSGDYAATHDLPSPSDAKPNPATWNNSPPHTDSTPGHSVGPGPLQQVPAPSTSWDYSRQSPDPRGFHEAARSKP